MIALLSAVNEAWIKRLSNLEPLAIFWDPYFYVLTFCTGPAEVLLLWNMYRRGMPMGIMMTLSVVGAILFGFLIGVAFYGERINVTQVAAIIGAIFCCAIALTGKVPGF